MKNKEFYDTSEFPTLISNLSLKEVMQLQFRCDNKKKWESVVIYEDPQKKMTVCNICKVAQYGEKNLFSHLNGKKHFGKMESVKQIRFPKANEQKKVVVKNANTIQKDNKKNDKSQDLVTAKKSSPPVKPAEPMINSNSKPAQPAGSPKPLSKQMESISTDVQPLKTTIPAAKPNKNVNNNNIIVTKSSKIKKKPIKGPSTLPNKSPVPITGQCGNQDLTDNISDGITENNAKPIASEECNKGNNSNPEEILEPKMEIIELIESDDVNAMNFSADSNIVVNPISKTAINEKKISCVPLAKLINKKTTNINHGEHNDNKVLLPSPSKSVVVPDSLHSTSSTVEVVTSRGKDNKHNRSDKYKGNPFAVIRGSDSYTSDSSDKSPTTFESSNVSEILGLLGVEYVIKIVKHIKDRTARFLCSLCDITADESSMHNHLLSINHRLKYCEKHFPTALRQYRQYISHVPEHQLFKILAPILEKLAIAIEKHHGRETSYLCYEYSFTKSRQNVISTVFNRRHSSEVLGPSFTHVIDSKDVDLLIENAGRNNDQPVLQNNVHNGVSHNPFSNNNTNLFDSNYPSNVNDIEADNIEAVDDETHKRMVDMFLRDTREAKSSRHRLSSRSGKRERSRSRSPDRKRKRSVSLLKSQWNLERRSLSPLREGDIWQAYRHLVDQSVRELNTTFDLYKSDPEEHPLYKEEWQKFWKRRKDELIAAGINHRNYNFQNEWILFFNARLEELYNQDVENIKIKCRERLCLPMSNNELPNSKYHVNCSVNEPVLAVPEKLTEQNNENIQNMKNDNVEDINVIHVLRLLTALENYLGSLGPSITEMLAKALQMSKVNPDNVNTFILTSENCAILETAKEKFTGLVISKMLDAAQERAIKKAITDTELLLKYADNIGRQHVGKDKELSNFQIEEPSSTLYNSASRPNTNASNNKSDQLKKTELAAKLASSLISQGKTKINQEQLKQIIQVYSQIELKKQHKMPSSSLTSVNNVTNALSSSMPNRLSASELEFQGNMSNNFNLHTPMQDHCPPITSSKYAIDRPSFSQNLHLPNTIKLTDSHNMETRQNYFSANTARTNYTNINKNPNEIINNMKDSQYNHQYDYGPYGRGNSLARGNDDLINRGNPFTMDDNYSFGRTENPREKSNWM